MELDALKAKQRTQQAQGAVGIVRGMAQAARGVPTPSQASDPTSAGSLSAGEQGPGARAGAEQEVSAEVAAPLSSLVPAQSGLPMAWPAMHVAEERTEAPQNGRRRQHP
jgi:hypothetical protein